ncbi:MAG TPA: hypothetical protein ACQGQF_00310 [Xylella fastidiosa subsp. pauca]
MSFHKTIRSHLTLDVIEHNGVPRAIAACVAPLDAMRCAADLNVEVAGWRALLEG